MDKEKDKSNIRKGGIFMYGTSILQSSQKFQGPSFKDKFKILLNKIAVQTSIYLNYKIQSKQENLIKNIEVLNCEYEIILNIIIENLDDSISELECSDYENIYINDLSELEDMVDRCHMNLLKIKTIISLNDFRSVKKPKRESLLNITNKNINSIIQIRDKISQLDDISENTRYYIEISEKYSFYKNIFLLSTIVPLFLYFLSSLSFMFVISYALIVFLLILGINIDKVRYFKNVFPNIDPKFSFKNTENSQLE